MFKFAASCQGNGPKHWTNLTVSIPDLGQVGSRLFVYPIAVKKKVILDRQILTFAPPTLCCAVQTREFMYIWPSVAKFINIMSSNPSRLILKLARFIKSANIARAQALSALVVS